MKTIEEKAAIEVVLKAAEHNVRQLKDIVSVLNPAVDSYKLTRLNKIIQEVTAAIEYLNKPIGLTFNKLRGANSCRDKIAFPQCKDWTDPNWAMCIAGEVGEYCNKLKKKLRGDSDITLDALAEELADIVLYTDLAANKLGIDLGEAIRIKFNQVSDKKNSDIKL